MRPLILSLEPSAGSLSRLKLSEANFRGQQRYLQRVLVMGSPGKLLQQLVRLLYSVLVV